MTLSSRLAATEQVCLEAIQERDQLLVKLERVEGERDELEALVVEAKCLRFMMANCIAVQDGSEPCGVCAWLDSHGYEQHRVSDGGLTAWRKGAPAVPARQMTLEDGRP